MKNNEIGNEEVNVSNKENISELSGAIRKLWVTAQDIAGLEGMPTTDRRTRDILEELASGKEGVKRKRRGTKAFEYNASILPPYVIDAVKRGGLLAIENPESSLHLRIDGQQYASDSDSLLNKFVLLPGYSVQVSAGYGAQAPGEEEPDRYLAFPRTWLKRRGFNEKELAVVWSKGDSMEPTISDNASLVVHLGRTRPIDGRIYVVRNDDQLWVKRLQVLPSAWLLLSDNKHYQPIEVPKDEQHTFEVIGQVVHIAHDVGE
ncbi:S24 family peptidase [Aeromonas enteropelogenes]|uniref:S24 family peptidase n=1 Tax=Aeromonas enteropelogenes TaxID=29489 RepID=UPI003B9F1FF2